MRQLFLNKGSVVIKEVCQPLLDEHSALVEVSYSFVSSGTEVATITASKQNTVLHNIPRKIKKVLESVSRNGVEGTRALIRGKLKGEVLSLGYSCSGRVLAVGKKVQHIKVGDYVACAGAGLANHADFVSVPEHLLVRLSGKEFLKTASITTVGSIALQGIRRASLQLGETVCVLGLGLLGQITVQLAKLSGCNVIGIDLLPERIELAKKNGAVAAFNATDNIQQEIAFLTEHYGVDSTIITAASKSDAIVQQAMEITRKKGKVVLVGDVGLHLQRSPLYKKEIDFLISCSYGPGRYDYGYEREGKDYPYAYVRWTENRNMQAFVQLLEQNRLNLSDLLAHEVSLDDVEKAYDALKEKNCLGVVLNYTHKKVVEKGKETSYMFKPARADSVRVGFVGAGGFAKIKLMPIVSRIKNVSINAVVDADITSATNAGKLYGACKALTDDKDLYKTDTVDVVVIATPHKFHCAQIIRSLQHGKAVFCEKPMVTDFQQFQQLSDFLEQNKDVSFCVDYNRSFAPYIQDIKQEVQYRATPLVVQYRMNAGYIPAEHWVQRDVGAGRIIGEACHIFDLFCFLTDSKPISVSVEALHGNKKDLFSNDNVCTQIRFEDGSICSLLYTALGHAGLGKERMELFFDGKSIVMNDYKELCGFGFSASFNKRTKTPDKGHEYLLKTFFRQLQQNKCAQPISFERMRTVSELALIINKLSTEGGGFQDFE